MPRAETVFIVTSPEEPGEGPVLALAEADSIFAGTDVPEVERFIPLPDEVDGQRLKAGMRVAGFGHIFVGRGADVRPEELHIVQKPATRHAFSVWD